VALLNIGETFIGHDQRLVDQFYPWLTFAVPYGLGMMVAVCKYIGKLGSILGATIKCLICLLLVKFSSVNGGGGRVIV